MTTSRYSPRSTFPALYYTPITTDTFDDPTVAMPTFVWDHVGVPQVRVRSTTTAMADPDRHHRLPCQLHLHRYGHLPTERWPGLLLKVRVVCGRASNWNRC
jgi:hypothetical protein